MAAIYQRTEKMNWLDPKNFVIDFAGILDSAVDGFATGMAGKQAWDKIQEEKKLALEKKQALEKKREKSVIFKADILSPTTRGMDDIFSAPVNTITTMKVGGVL